MAKAGVPQRSYTIEEKRRGMTELALCGGNYRLAAKRLKERGYEIPARTLQCWPEYHAEEYERLRADLSNRIHAKIAAEAEELALREAEVAAKLLERVAETAQDLKPGEAAGALRNVEVSKAVNIDKALLLRGKPTAIREDRTATELWRHLAKLVPQAISQDDVVDATVVEDESELQAPPSDTRVNDQQQD